jgi:hypothetical protein
MKTRILSAALLAGAVAFFATAQANAAVSVAVELVNPGTAYPTFSSPTSNPPADSTTGIVNQNVIGTIPNTQRSPFDDPTGAATAASAVNAYTAVLGGASATYSITTLAPSNPGAVGISFLWGSPDFFNSVTFFNGAVPLGTVSSLDLTNPNGNPPQNPATGQSWVVLLAGGAWTSVVFSSNTNAFEFASLFAACSTEGATCAPPPGVPLPAALPLFAGGLGFLGFLARRRKQKAVA